MARRESARAKALQAIGLLPPSVDYQQQAAGLARQLGRSGYGPTATGGQPTPEQAAGQTATGLLMDPNTRQMGVEQAQGLLGQVGQQADPLYRQQLGNAQAEASYGRTNQQAKGFGNLMGAVKFREEMARWPQERQLLQAQIGATNRSGQAAQSTGDMSVYKYLTDNYQANMKAPADVADAVQQIQGSLKTGNSLGGLAATIKLAKILDPTSVVREGEVTTVQGGIGTAQQLISSFNQLFSKGWTPEAQKAFSEIARQVAGPLLQRGMRIQQETHGQALQLGINPAIVTTGIGFPERFVSGYLQGFPDPEVATDF